MATFDSLEWIGDDESGLGMCGWRMGYVECWWGTFNSVGWIWNDKSELVARVGSVVGIQGYI